MEHERDYWDYWDYWIFITHTVQMELRKKLISAEVIPHFITHTVQMELACQSWRCAWFNLYNPHGSDGTIIELEKLKEQKELYNPHGSDGTKKKWELITRLIFFITHTVQMERSLPETRRKKIKKLYNPHGSDGTIKISDETFKIRCFITHTVQMELIRELLTSEVYVTL